MSRQAEMVAFFFAPFVSSTMRVERAWLDDDGHGTTAHYHAMFDRGLREAFACLGLGESYRLERDCAIVTAEAHVQYRRELAAGERARVTVQLIDFDDERIHLYSEIRHATELWLSATAETLNLHVRLDRSVRPFPPEILASLAIMKAAHAGLPRPATLGRVLEIPRRRVETGVH